MRSLSRLLSVKGNLLVTFPVYIPPENRRLVLEMSINELTGRYRGRVRCSLGVCSPIGADVLYLFLWGRFPNVLVARTNFHSTTQLTYFRGCCRLTFQTALNTTVLSVVTTWLVRLFFRLKFCRCAMC